MIQLSITEEINPEEEAQASVERENEVIREYIDITV